MQARIEGLYAYVASLRMQVQAGGAAAVRYWTSLVAMDELGRELQKRLDAADPPAPAREIHDAFRRTIGDFALSAREILAAEFAGPTTASDDPSTPSRGQRTLQLSIIEYQYLGVLLEDLLRPYRAPVPVGEPSPRTSGSPAP